jgi:antitoxin component YwqK of YwqJK toxin-antitoxin module
VTIQKRYYSQYLNSFSRNKKDKLQSIETYVKYGDNGLIQEGFAEYWYKNGKKKEEIIYSRKNGNRYINQWETNFNQNLKSGEGVYIEMGYGMMGMDSLVCEVKDSLLHGKYTKYTQNEMGEYVVQVVQDYVENKPVGVKEIFDLRGVKLIEEEYFSHTDSIFQTNFYPDGQISKAGIIYRDRKFRIWKNYSKSGQLEKECEYEDDYKSGKYKEYYSNGIVKIAGNYKILIEEGDEDIVKFDILTRKTITTKNKVKTSVKDGKWTYHNEQGVLEKIEFFQDGELIN